VSARKACGSREGRPAGGGGWAGPTLAAFVGVGTNLDAVVEGPLRSDAAAVLSARALHKVYGAGETEVRALDGVDFTLRAGEILVLLGPSGSGKSTLLNILGGLDLPSSGAIRFRDQDLSHASDDELTEFRRAHVGFVFQFYNLVPSLTARENVQLAADLVPSPMPPAEALAVVGLGARLDHFPSQLSGGEQQRVAIARAIAKRPAVLLCDEPTGALDGKTGRLVLDALLTVNRQLGTATAIITHNAVIGAMGDRVVTMKDGRIAEERVNPGRRPPAELDW
jgi:putative ABC transport system ATP-binding protein